MELRLLLKKGFIVLLAKLVGTFISFVFVFLLARFLGASGFGSYFLAFTIISIVSVFAKWGLDVVLLKKVASEKQHDFLKVKGYLYSSLIFVLMSSLLLTVLLQGSLPVISGLFFDSIETAKAFELFTWSIVPFSLMYVAAESFKSVDRPLLATLFQNIIIPFVAVLFLLIMYYFFQLSLMEAVLGYVIGVCIAFILTMIYVLKEYPYEPFKCVKFIKLYKAGKPMLLISSGALVMSWTDILVLGMFETEDAVGVYAVATKIVLLNSLFLVAMGAITAPIFARLYSDNKMKELAMLAQKSSLILLALAVVSFIVIIIFSKKIIGIFGTEFVSGSGVLVILAFGQVVNVSCGFVGLLLTMTGKEKIMQTIMLITAFINIVLSLFLVNVFGMVGVAYATAFSIVIWNVWAMFEVKKHLGFWSLSLNLIIKKIRNCPR